MDAKSDLIQSNEKNQQVNEQNNTNSPSASNKKDEDSEGEAVLEARVRFLRQTISALKNELLEEKALWKKEVELMANMIASNERCLETDLSSDTEMDMKTVLTSSYTSTDPLATSPLIRDYEEKLTRYQGALAQAQAEKRFNIRRQIAANTYRKRLSEVEKLCQEELDKVRETATYLEPLKQIASEWNKVKPHYMEPLKSPSSATTTVTEKLKRRSVDSVECGGDYLSVGEREASLAVKEADVPSYDIPVKQIDASLVMDEDAASEIKGKIVLQLGSLPSEVPTICYSAKFE